MDFTTALLSILTIHLLASISPGPDFVVVSQNTLSHGRKQGLLCGIGVCTGILFHISYSVTGLAVAIQHSNNLIRYIGIFGGCYLIFLGYKSIKSSINNKTHLTEISFSSTKSKSAFWSGFIVNIFNPKAAIYFVSLFSLFISTELSIGRLIIIVTLIITVQMSWYFTFIYLITIPKVRNVLEKKIHYIDRFLGLLLILMGGYMVIKYSY